MYTPSLPFYRQIAGLEIEAITAKPIKKSATPATVYRLNLEMADGSSSTLITKRANPNWPHDPNGHKREAFFYKVLLPKLELVHAHIYYAGPEPDSEATIVIMEDLAQSYRFPPRTHIWSQAEIHSGLKTYALLHARGEHILPLQDDGNLLMARHEERVLTQAADLPSMVADINRRGFWPAFPGFDHFLYITLEKIKTHAQFPATLLHNDVFPPNLALPLSPGEEVILIDWEMAGLGLCEMDLAFMFLQPFRSHRQLDRAAALAYYWGEREKLGGLSLPEDERRERQIYADTLWILWLIPVAHKMVLNPHPPGSPVRNYWDSMINVLGESLQTLSHVLQ